MVFRRRASGLWLARELDMTHQSKALPQPVGLVRGCSGCRHRQTECGARGGDRIGISQREDELRGDLQDPLDHRRSDRNRESVNNLGVSVAV